MSVSEDFAHWTPPAPFLSPLHEEEALYNNTGFNYGAQYLGILTHFDKRPLEQTQVLRLLSSRDGDNWDRVPGDPLVGLGEVGEWDRFQLLLTGAPPIPVGDSLYIYYRGTARRHAKNPKEFDPRIALDQDPGTMAIGLATLRLDGFASMNASFNSGSLTTRPFLLGGDELRVNVKSDYGKLVAELLDLGGKVIPGYASGDCAEVSEDAVSTPVNWGNGPDLKKLRKPTRQNPILPGERPALRLLVRVGEQALAAEQVHHQEAQPDLTRGTAESVGLTADPLRVDRRSRYPPGRSPGRCRGARQSPHRHRSRLRR